MWFDIQVRKDDMFAFGKVFVRAEGPSKTVKVEVTQDGTTVFEREVQTGSAGLTTIDIELGTLVASQACMNPTNTCTENPKLWYPHGYGSQPLYQIRAQLLGNDGLLDEVIKKTGIRRAELIQDKDDIGESFYFRVNGIDVFAGGSNWIPADNFLPRISEQKYRSWLQLAIEGGQNMVRYVACLLSNCRAY
jgi:beta-mannosidase